MFLTACVERLNLPPTSPIGYQPLFFFFSSDVCGVSVLPHAAVTRRLGRPGGSTQP